MNHTENNTKKQYKYDVFISYKHAPLDMLIASTLQKSLEHYKLSKEIQKKTGKKKLKRVFRDKEELAVGSDLNAEIDEQLENSEFLVILCSKASKQSPWVNRELKMFLQYHDIMHVLPVIIDGEPNEVYPDLLLEYGEPFALDVRGENDRDSLRKLKKDLPKLMAPILYCSYDELIQRQKRYQMQRFGILASIIALVLLGFSGYALFQNRKLEKAHQQTLRESSKILIEQARIALEEGDRITAMEYLLQALPKDGEDFPLPPQLQYYLTEAVDYYGESNQQIKLTRLQKDINDEGENELLTDEDGAYVLTRSGNVISVWDGESLKKVQEIMIPSAFYHNEIQAHHLCGQHRILLYDSDFVSLYDYVTGEQLWKTRFSQDVQKISCQSDSNTVYVFLPHAVYHLDLNSGQKKKAFSINLEEYEITSKSLILSSHLQNNQNVYYIIASKSGDTEGCKKLLQFHEHTGDVKEIAPELTCNLDFTDAYDRTFYYEEILYYTSLNIEDKIVTLSAYDTKKEKMLWQNDFPYQGSNNSYLSAYSLDNSDKSILYFYVGRSYFTVDPKKGNMLRTNVMGEGHIAKTFPMTNNRIRILTSSGDVIDHRLDENDFNIFGLGFSDILNIEWENNGYFVLTQKHHLEKYENVTVGENVNQVAELTGVIDDVFLDHGFLMINAGDKYYYKKMSEENVSATSSNVPATSSLEEIDLNEIGNPYDISYKGIQDDIIIFIRLDNMFLQESDAYLLWDMNKKTWQEESIDFSRSDEFFKSSATASTDSFSFYGNSNFLKGKLYIYDRIQKTASSFIYGAAKSVSSICPSPDSKRVIVCDWDSLSLKILDPEQKKCLQEISLADWSQNALDLFSFKYPTKSPFAQWTKDSQFFLMTNQDSIFVYDCNGQEVARIPYNNVNTSTKVECPFVALSPDGNFVYYVYDNILYQISLKTKELLNTEKLPDHFSTNNDDNYHKLTFEFDSENNLYLFNQTMSNMLKIQTDTRNFGKLYPATNVCCYEEETHRLYVNTGYYEKKIGYIDEVSFETILEMAKKMLNLSGTDEEEKEENSSGNATGNSVGQAQNDAGNTMGQAKNGVKNSVGNSLANSMIASGEESIWSSYHRFLLQNRPGISEKDAKKNLEILQNALEYLPKDSNIILEETETNDGIILSIPKAFCDSKELVEALLTYLTRPMEYVLDNTKLTLLPEDILSLEHGQGDLPEGIVVKGVSADGVSAKNCCYFRFRFTDSFMNRMNKQLSDKECTEILFMDKNYKDATTDSVRHTLPDMTLYKGGDGYYYCLYEDLNILYGFEDFFEYLLTHERLNSSFIFHYMLDINWEQDEGTFGEYQCRIEELPEDHYYFQYSSKTSLTKDQLKKAENMIKSRLDVFKLPYAFGNKEGEGFAFYMVSNPFSETEMRCIALSAPTYYSLYCLRSGDDIIYADFDGILEWIEDSQKYKVRPGDKMKDSLKELRKKNIDTIYLDLAVEKNEIASLNFDEITSMDELLFTPLPMEKERCAFYQEIIMNPDLGADFNFDYCK